MAKKPIHEKISMQIENTPETTLHPTIGVFVSSLLTRQYLFGLVELCPEEYDMTRLDQMLDDALAECEQLVLGIGEQTVRSDGGTQ
jgi:hypothetical protein